MTSTIEPLAVFGWLLLMLVVAVAAVLSVLAARTASGAGGRVWLAVATGLLGAGVVIAALVAPIPPVMVVLLTVGVLVTGVAGGDPATRWILARTTFGDAVGSHGGLMADDGRELLRGGQMIVLLAHT